MSYVINVHAATQDEAFRQLGDLLQQKTLDEPKHLHEAETVAQATAEFLSLLDVSENDDVSIAISGTNDEGSIGFSITVQRHPR